MRSAQLVPQAERQVCSTRAPNKVRKRPALDDGHQDSQGGEGVFVSLFVHTRVETRTPGRVAPWTGRARARKLTRARARPEVRGI